MNRPASAHGAAPQRHITLLVPGLFGNPSVRVEDEPPATPPHTPALLRLLARADREPLAADGYEARLFAQFGIAPEPGQDLPVAAVARVADMGVVDREWWLRADPVHLEPRRDGLVLYAGLDLSPDEAEQLVAELNEALAADGWLLKAPHPERWYLKPPAAPAMTTTPLAAVVGRDIHPLLPQGPDGKSWHTRLNEIQILLHTSPVNAAREAHGRLPANSVWFWGGGRLPAVGGAGWARMWSEEPLGLGLARLAGIPAQAPPASAAEVLAKAAGGPQLLVLETAARARRQAEAAWQQAVQALDRDWFAPLVAGVQQGALDSVGLVAERGPVFRYRRGHRWRLWRRTRPLAAWREAAA
jgi:hypothetical protein